MVGKLGKIHFSKPINKIGNYKIMTSEEIIEEHKEFHNMETIICYLYTKIKELERKLRTKVGDK